MIESANCPAVSILPLFLSLTGPWKFGLEHNHSAEDYNSQPPLKLIIAMGVSSGQEDFNGIDVNNL